MITIKIMVFCVVLPCSSVDRYQCYRRTCCLQLQGSSKML